MLGGIFITAGIQSMREGNVFTHVYHSVHTAVCFQQCHGQADPPFPKAADPLQNTDPSEKAILPQKAYPPLPPGYRHYCGIQSTTRLCASYRNSYLLQVLTVTTIHLCSMVNVEVSNLESV